MLSMPQTQTSPLNPITIGFKNFTTEALSGELMNSIENNLMGE
jgi:hypothetical protein